ncbi:hypothetical protein [Liquorilactobacillus vini]|uniref:hypothetical protein n=1 Tax=Liquorilactobacillus vini TaxID=238015 RepID=UPI0002DB765B|nr:hypothetical protein [Liquorilactobacillus vini]
MRGSHYRRINQKINVIASLIGFILLVTIVAWAGISRHHQQVEANRTSAEIYQIRTQKKALKNSKTDTQRLQRLKTLENDYQTYLDQKSQNRRVINEYQAVISSGRRYFIQQIEQTLQQNTIADLKHANKRDLQAKLKKLQHAKTLLQRHQQVIFASTQRADDFQKQFTSLIKKYSNRLQKLDQKADQAAAKSSTAQSTLTDSAANTAKAASSSDSHSLTTASSATSAKTSSTTTYYYGETSGSSYAGTNYAKGSRSYYHARSNSGTGNYSTETKAGTAVATDQSNEDSGSQAVASNNDQAATEKTDNQQESPATTDNNNQTDQSNDNN